MKIYVASSWHNKALVQSTMAALRAAEHTITCDWTTFSDEPPNGETFDDYLQRMGSLDIAGVVDADVLVVLPHRNQRNTFFEMGLAHGMLKPIVTVGSRAGIESPFWHTAIDCPDTDTLIEALKQPARALSMYPRDRPLELRRLSVIARMW